MLQQLLADPSAAVLSLLELHGPVVDGRVQLCKSFLLLEDGIVAELGSPGRAEVLADACMQVASASSK